MTRPKYRRNNLEKNKEIQTLGSKELVRLIGLISLATFLYLINLNSLLGQGPEDSKKLKAQIMAYQAIQIHLMKKTEMKKTSSNSRSPASIEFKSDGLFGGDRENSIHHYTVQSGNDGKARVSIREDETGLLYEFDVETGLDQGT